jgi:hypothetical protein
MAVRMNNLEAMSVTCLAQYPTLPEEMQNHLISLISPKYRPIGQMLAGRSPDYSTVELKKAVKQLQNWASNNRRKKRK